MTRTPGPWHVDGWNLTAVIAEDGRGGYKHVCTCDYGYSEPEKHLELNKDNARLIAAAPELLEALQAYVDSMLSPEDQEKWYNQYKNDKQANLVLVKAIEAIKLTNDLSVKKLYENNSLTIKSKLT